MSSLKLDNIQVGRDSDPTKNFHFRTVAANDFRLSSGNIGSPVNDLMKLTNTDVTLLNPKAIATPPQFDNSKLLATTDWVKQNGLNFREQINISSGLILDTSYLGKFTFITGGGTTQILPVAAQCPNGSCIMFQNTTNQEVYLQRNSSTSNLIYVASTGLTSIGIRAGEAVLLITDGFNWSASGTGVLRHSGSFEKSFSTNGYQRLPSGLILQWGTTSNVTYDSRANLTFPISFPTTCCSVVVSYQGPTVLTDHCQSYGVSNITTSGFQVENQWVYGSNGNSFPAKWIAIGY